MTKLFLLGTTSTGYAPACELIDMGTMTMDAQFVDRYLRYHAAFLAEAVNNDLFLITTVALPCDPDQVTELEVASLLALANDAFDGDDMAGVTRYRQQALKLLRPFTLTTEL